ncbi:hypothetical protein KSP40_PGU019892 [Platanthera guangdongensis]|uniref:Uncharacterized protein n=1 Tax=Platanthera guangdongensis TaxID=2320717 RepID=A0ABR2LLA0_9ASPA
MEQISVCIALHYPQAKFRTHCNFTIRRMADIGLKILDGTELRSGDLRLPIDGGYVGGERLLEMAEEEAAAPPLRPLLAVSPWYRPSCGDWQAELVAS